MPVYSITSTPKFVSGVYTQPYIVKNSGDNPVYLGQDSSLTVLTRAFSLPSGSTLNWSGDTELWAITDPGKIGELEILFTGQNSFTPGPSTIALGNFPTLLQTIVVNQPAGTTTDTILSQLIDTTGYSSLLFVLQKSSFGTPGSADYIALSIQQQSVLTNSFWSDFRYCEWSYGSTSGANNLSSFQIPVKAQFTYAAVQYKRTATTLDTFSVLVFGTNESIATPRYTNGSSAENDLGYLTSGAFVINATGGASAPTQIAQRIGSRSGTAFTNIVGGGGTGSNFIFVYMFKSGLQYIINQNIYSLSPYTPQAFALPFFPISVTVNAPTGSSQNTYALIQDS